MASLFSHNRILPNLKRRSRSTNKSEPSPVKSKALHILPNVAEEDEQATRHSCSSTSSLPSATNASRFHNSCATVGARPSVDQVIHIKRESRRVVLTGVEGLSFDDFFPMSSAPRVRTPSPTPPERIPSPPPRSAASSPGSDSPLNDINLRFSGLGISTDFPSPPPVPSLSRSASRRRELSPTPSNASSDASSSGSSPKTPCTTPPTSDDESTCKAHLARAPTFRSQRASVLFMKSMPDLSEAPRKASIASTVDNESILEELEWIARDVSDLVTLSTPLPPTFPTTPTESQNDIRARPDSIFPPNKHTGPGRSRVSKPLPIVPRISIQESPAHPSAQLDPTFPLRRRSYLVPSRPPPPPPVPKSPTTAMELATEELLAELANAALGAGFLGTELTIPQDGYLSAESLPPTPSSTFIVRSPSPMRPPPRSAIPADINDQGESPVELTIPVDPTASMWPSTPQSVSVYSQMTDRSPPTSPLSSFDFDVDVSHVLSHREEASSALEGNAAMRRSPSNISLVPSERPLRSRWSTSTLGSLAENSPHSATSWLPRFHLSPTKKEKAAAKPKPASPVASPLQRKNAVKSHGAKRSVDSDSGLTRRDSRASRMSESSDSGESTMSNGLKRKPIPIALLAAAA
ncbi:hypothetical protein PYCCODRAFT_1477606 [Trametes coccinea BRFM310]|uniref:Uncharacterized protein n=1 Tax=Trametes coccinea (strain BRFM310) TaxID=1353009 RepID=A0A1Y2IQX2_TRAC3|nr:hypothetical protein PYCCODRAFT_1477606 [Trametes coccinea BRFM310]